MNESLPTTDKKARAAAIRSASTKIAAFISNKFDVVLRGNQVDYIGTIIRKELDKVVSQ